MILTSRIFTVSLGISFEHCVISNCWWYNCFIICLTMDIKHNDFVWAVSICICIYIYVYIYLLKHWILCHNLIIPWLRTMPCSVWYIVMPPPLGAGGIMFSGCPSVRPSEAWNTLFWPVHRSVGPHDQPLPFYGMSVRPSVRLSVGPSVRLSVRRGFRAFARECMAGMAWNFTCWCILTVYRTD